MGVKRNFRTRSLALGFADSKKLESLPDRFVRVSSLVAIGGGGVFDDW